MGQFLALSTRADGRIDMACLKQAMGPLLAPGATLPGTGDRPDLSAARAKLAETQEQLARLKLERERGLLLPADEVEAGWQSAIGRSRALLLGIPPSASERILLAVRAAASDEIAARAIRDLLTKLIDASLDELANLDFDADASDEPEAV